jgi:hypothetical protein
MVSIQRYFSAIGLFALALVAPQIARATGEACINDIDCKTGPTCGGEICDWTKLETCQPASATGSGHEGWCTASTDCKCNSEGATCVLNQCTKTVDAAGAGGASGSAGATSSSAGSSAAGTSSEAGSSAAGSSDSSSGSSGCSVAGGMPHGSLGFAFGAMCAAALIGARRKRRVG